MANSTHFRTVGLRVQNLDEMVSFYEEVVGLQSVEQDSGRVALVADEGEAPILFLDDAPDAPKRPNNAAGLFHMAIRLPDREALSHALRRVEQSDYELTGASDHRVSEALYMNDPEGNGLELYRDFPKDRWPRRSDGRVVMDTLRLDLNDVRSETDEAAPTAPAKTELGHVHLEVTDLIAMSHFCRKVLGMDRRARQRGANFFAYDDYHHHIAVNTWQHRSEPRSEQAQGLDSIYGHLDSEEAGEKLAERARDKEGIEVEVSEGVVTLRDTDNFHWQFCMPTESTDTD